MTSAEQMMINAVEANPVSMNGTDAPLPLPVRKAEGMSKVASSVSFDIKFSVQGLFTEGLFYIDSLIGPSISFQRHFTHITKVHMSSRTVEMKDKKDHMSAQRFQIFKIFSLEGLT